ncbi:DUF445 domain-containing protein [Bacillus sp. UMB0899]|nr:DUF445 domain-containing protein [Bacillus sp. UMB0899]
MMSTKTKESKKIASYSLIIMGTGFIACTPFQGSLWVDLVQGGFEAGLVGGLADWFAVTALFRHPLGLRIPHTALLPKNRKRMTNAIISILKNDWLSKESILEKTKQIPFTEKLSTIMEKEIHTESFKKNLTGQLKKLIRYIDAEKLTPFVKKQLESTLSNLNISHFLQKILLNQQIEKKGLDYLLNKAEVWLANPRTKHQLGTISMNVLSKVEVEGILQFALKSIQNLLDEEKMGNIIKNLLLSVIKTLKHEGEPNREALIKYIQNEILSLNENKAFIDGVEKWKIQLLDSWEPDQKITESIKRIQENAIELVEDQEFVETKIIPFIVQLLNDIKKENVKIDYWIQEHLAVLIEKNHSQIGNLVQENLDKLDNEKLIDMMENNIGKDLQWIRVNGAVCGFLIGIFLTGVQELISLI